MRLILASALLASVTATSAAQAAPLAAAPHLFAERWIDGTQSTEPKMQVQQLDDDTFVIRQSVHTNFEAPFLYLLFGHDKALLVDTGAGNAPVRETVDGLIAGWLKRHGKTSIPLVVAHSHSHGDHIAGDASFADRPGTTVIGHDPGDVAAAFGIAHWPDTLGRIDLGGRVIRVIPTPGHQIAHAMYYDPRLKILLSGDAMYPGRLYVPVNHMAEERASIDRVVAFLAHHPVRAALGAHIEMTREPGKDYVQAAPTHPDEHRLELAPAEFLALQKGLKAKLDTAGEKQVHDNFIVVVVPARDK